MVKTYFEFVTEHGSIKSFGPIQINNTPRLGEWVNAFDYTGKISKIVNTYGEDGYESVILYINI